MVDAPLRTRAGELLQAIREALASEARPSAEGLRYLRELREQAAQLGAEIARRGVSA